MTSVTVLESRDRTGGRIHSMEWHGAVVEEGAQFIHGQKGNTVYQMANESGLVVGPGEMPYQARS